MSDLQYGFCSIYQSLWCSQARACPRVVCKVTTGFTPHVTLDTLVQTQLAGLSLLCAYLYIETDLCRLRMPGKPYPPRVLVRQVSQNSYGGLTVRIDPTRSIIRGSRGPESAAPSLGPEDRIAALPQPLRFGHAHSCPSARPADPAWKPHRTICAGTAACLTAVTRPCPWHRPVPTRCNASGAGTRHSAGAGQQSRATGQHLAQCRPSRDYPYGPSTEQSTAAGMTLTGQKCGRRAPKSAQRCRSWLPMRVFSVRGRGGRRQIPRLAAATLAKEALKQSKPGYD